MTYYLRNSKISQLINFAFKQNFDDLAKKLLEYRYQDCITDNMEIRYTEDVALLEEIVRTLTDIDILSGCCERIFVVLGAPESKLDYLTWFIKLFAFIESETSNWETTEKDISYATNDNHRKVFEDARIDFELDLSNMWFLYDDVLVLFRESRNS